jgi:peroxiredoxin Q/BCP
MVQQALIMVAILLSGSVIWLSAPGCSRDPDIDSQAGRDQQPDSESESQLVPRDDLIPLGNDAPDFTAKDQDGNVVTLSKLLETRSVVLVFYPADNTPTCTKQLCAVRDDWSKFQDKGATVLGINPASVSKHARFAQKHDFPFPVLSDEDSRIAKAYGASGTLFIQRSVYVIDRDGKVRLADRGVVSHDRIFAALDESRASG